MNNNVNKTSLIGNFEVEVVVLNLETNTEHRMVLPDSEEYDKFIEEDESDYEIVDVEDEYNLFIEYKLYGYENLKTLNKIAQRLSELNDNNDVKKILAYSECMGGNLKEALEQVESESVYLFEDMHNFSDYAYKVVEEGYMEEIPENIINYIDYEKFGRQLSMDGNIHKTKYGILEII